MSSDQEVNETLLLRLFIKVTFSGKPGATLNISSAADTRVVETR